jgi:hypothetical protein
MGKAASISAELSRLMTLLADSFCAKDLNTDMTRNQGDSIAKHRMAFQTHPRAAQRTLAATRPRELRTRAEHCGRAGV